MSHTFADGAIVIGMTNRLRQFDADHQNCPSSARAGLRSGLASAFSPAANGDSALHVASAPLQLMPMMGMTTIEQGTAAEHPSDWFSAEVLTTNGTEPVPSVRVWAKSSCGGTGDFVASRICSGAADVVPQGQNSVPLAATNGTSRRARSALPRPPSTQAAGHRDTSGTESATSASVAYASWVHTASSTGVPLTTARLPLLDRGDSSLVQHDSGLGCWSAGSAAPLASLVVPRHCRMTTGYSWVVPSDRLTSRAEVGRAPLQLMATDCRPLRSRVRSAVTVTMRLSTTAVPSAEVVSRARACLPLQDEPSADAAVGTDAVVYPVSRVVATRHSPAAMLTRRSRDEPVPLMRRPADVGPDRRARR